MSDRVKVPVSMMTPAGKLTVELVTTDDSVPIEHVFPRAAALSEALVQTANELAQVHGKEIQCRRGCDACCHQLIPTAPIEAMALLDALEAMEPNQRAEVAERFANAKARVVEAGLESGLQDVVAERGGRDVMRAYFELNIPCPFLEDGACSVYEARPMGCRELLVVSDPEHCQEFASPSTRRVPMLTEMSRVLYGLSASVWKDTPSRMPLIWALDWAAEQREQSTMKAKGRDLIKGMLSLMSRQQARGVSQAE